MQMDRIILHYQREDDILCVTFGQEGRKGMGFNLHNNILLRFDRHTGDPLGMTFIDYSKLKTLASIPLNNLAVLPEELQKIVHQILFSDPVCRFIELDPNTFSHFSVVNPSMERVIAADFLEERARRGSWEKFQKVLEVVPDVESDAQDRF